MKFLIQPRAGKHAVSRDARRGRQPDVTRLPGRGRLISEHPRLRLDQLPDLRSARPVQRRATWPRLRRFIGDYLSDAPFVDGERW